MKTLCFATENLNVLLSDLFMTTAEIVFCEEREFEVVSMPNGREILIEDAFEEIGKRFNAEVESYDVMELGERGEVHVFFLK